MQNSNFNKGRCALALAVATAAMSFTAAATAAPYASGVTQSGDSVNFTLNEVADEVTVVFDGGARTENLGSLTRGTHTVNLGTNSSYEIRVSDTAAASGYTLTDRVGFFSPKGVSVNRLPGTANFGDIYVSESTAGTPDTTVIGPARNVGFYKLAADFAEQDFGTAGLTRTGAQTYGKTSIGRDGNLYNANLSSDIAHQISDNLDSNIALTDASNRTPDTSSTTNNAQFVTSVEVTGTGTNRQLFVANSNFNDTATKGVIRYNLSGTTVAPDDRGTRVIDGADVDNYFASDVEVDSAGNIYVATNRFTAGQANPVVKFDSAGNEIFSVPNTYTGGNSLALSEELGVFAYGSFYDGMVYVFNATDGALVTSFDAGGPIQDLDFDILGNLYTVSSSDEILSAYGIGTSQIAITRSDGTFAVTPVPEPGAVGLLAIAGLGLLRRRRQA